MYPSIGFELPQQTSQFRMNEDCVQPVSSGRVQRCVWLCLVTLNSPNMVCSGVQAVFRRCSVGVHAVFSRCVYGVHAVCSGVRRGAPVCGPVCSSASDGI